MASRAKGLTFLGHRESASFGTGSEEGHVRRSFTYQSRIDAALEPDKISNTRGWHLEKEAQSNVLGNLLAPGTAYAEEQVQHTQVKTQLD